MIFGNRWSGVERLIPWVTDFGLPLWMLEHATEIGVDPERIVLVGTSAGGGLAAATALAARDRDIQQPIAQLLMYPMLDDRDATVSTHPFSTGGLWDRISNDTGWTALLGDARGSADVPSYAAPAREQDLTNLPPAFIDCGSAEVFRDEDAAYATGIWAAGGEAELHVWPGGFHSFEGFAPEAALSREMTSSREARLRRILGF